MNSNKQLVDFLIQNKYLKTKEIINAFYSINRADFVLPEFQSQAYENYPLSIGQGQTISQPATVAFMLELLQPKPGNKILDIGSGSGWQTALLAFVAAKHNNNARIFALERIPELKEFGEKNVRKYNFVKSGIVKFICANAEHGLKKYAPFDRIIAAACAEQVPCAWKQQLKINGRMVLPIKNSIWLYIKKSKNKFIKKEFPGFVFVPLILDS